MKITANRKAFAEALAWVANALPRNAQVPATAGIVLHASDDALTLSAFDYDRQHTARIPADVSDPGQVLVSGRFMATAAAGLKGDAVALTADDSALTITAARSEYRTQLMRIEDYPRLPDFPAPVGSIAEHRLNSLLAVVAPIATDDAPNAGQVGIRLESNDRGLWACACSQDRSTIHVAVAEWDAADEIALTVPTTVIGAIKGLSGTVELAAVEGMIGLRDASRTITLRTYDALYLAGKWRETVANLSAKEGARYTFTTHEFVAAAKQVGALSDDLGHRRIVAEFAPSDVRLSVSGSTGGGDEYVAVAGDADTTVYLNAAKVAQSFPVLGETVTANIPSTGAITLRPAERDDALVVMLPLRGLR